MNEPADDPQNPKTIPRPTGIIGVPAYRPQEVWPSPFYNSDEYADFIRQNRNTKPRPKQK